MNANESQSSEQRGSVGIEADGQGSADTLRTQLEELKDKNLRLIAEQRNLQQRMQREREEALRFAEADFARELLVVIDDLERTLDSARSVAGAEAIADGVRIIHQQFMKVLRSRGIEPISTVGASFDPGAHEALLQQPSAEHPAGVVTQELARGYRMHQRVLRPARVVVSSGPTER